MAPEHDDTKGRNEEALRTAEALRLVRAFHNVDNPLVREALIVIAEQLGASKERLQ
ncbi:MAG: hypothetical protein AB1586_06790 [Pseudomonadota bacterium]